jgi:hypothetical protein
MASPSDWERWYSKYLDAREDWLAGLRAAAYYRRLESPTAARRHFAAPTEEDIAWLSEALGDEERKWFVSNLAESAETMGDGLLPPMLLAAVDELNPSANKDFVWPCVSIFGLRRVNEFLLDVLETGSDFRKAGAVRALYWAGVPVRFVARSSSHRPDHDLEARAASSALNDLWQRRRALLLTTFVENDDIDVRRSLIPSLTLDPAAYPEHLGPLVVQAIEIARGSDDEYLRHRVEIQLGHEGPLRILPPRRMPGEQR